MRNLIWLTNILIIFDATVSLLIIAYPIFQKLGLHAYMTQIMKKLLFCELFHDRELVNNT